MKKTILLAIIAFSTLAYAQKNNQELEKQLENNKNQTEAQYDFYIQNQLSPSSFSDKNNDTDNSILLNELKKEKSKLAFFFQGKPYFYSHLDTDQIISNNIDVIHNGQITGINGSFQGNGIKVSIFDGGRIYENHSDFVGTSSRITSKEDSSLDYDAHATGVASVIGGKGYDYTEKGIIKGNTKGMIPLATMDSYSFNTTILLGDTSNKNVRQKLLHSLAYLSNHSYGMYLGWQWNTSRPNNAGSGWYWVGEYDPNTKQSYSLNGVYYESDKDYDDIVYNNPQMIVVKAAGNSYGFGPKRNSKKYYNSDTLGNTKGYKLFTNNDNIPPSNCSDGYDCIGEGSLAKNIIIVGATDKITNNGGKYTLPSDIKKASYSSAGPRDDGAIKPDISAIGTDVYVASTDFMGSNDWDKLSGTSFASPQVTGIIGLWLEIYKNLNNNQMFGAASAKTLLIHSAKEAGNIGPDVWFGWGFADAQAGANLIVKKKEGKIIFEEKVLKNREKENIFLKSDGIEPLKVSISWIDPSFKKLPTTYEEAHNNRISRLINDLDLRIINTKTNEVYYPWKLNINDPMAPASKGDNRVDNVEQVLIDSPEEGIYKVEISHKEDLLDNSENITKTQKYTLIATGYNDIVSPESMDNKESENIVVYPTIITNNTTTIHYPKNIDSVDVYDMAGRLLYSKKVNDKEHKINFHNYASGVYIISIKTSDSKEITNKKVIKK